MSSPNQISPLGSFKGSSSSMDRRVWNLALAFQEVFTAVGRLKTGRQAVTNAASFRSQLKQALHSAEQEALGRGYNVEDVRRVIFMMVAFVDESVLSCKDAIFADWPRLPLQSELFGHQLAGEIVFQEIQKLLGRQDSHEVADVLEVFYLCLLLGFQGRYAASPGQGDLYAISTSMNNKIRRIRGASSALSPRGAVPADALRVGQTDAWVRRLKLMSIVSVSLAFILFIALKLILVSAAAAGS
jgi:type VI secretion system protein ImpK